MARMRPTRNVLSTERKTATGARPETRSLAHGAAQLPHLGRHVAEVRVLAVEVGEQAEGLFHLPVRFVGHREVVTQARVLLFVAARGLESLLEPLHGHL